jgi:hypothetical protein
VPGQPATLRYRLSLRQDRMRAIKEPALTPPTGLLVLGDRSDKRTTTTDAEGRTWSVQTWSWPVTAAVAGTIEARGQQEWYRCREDVFGQLLAESTHQVAIRPGVLTVSAMPEAGRPEDFSGLIGPLQASAAIERSRIASGEGTVLTVTLRGPQVGLGRRPALVLPPTVQAYPKDDANAAGERHFRWDLVPGAAGELVVPALSFPYFDPATRTYRRAATEPITVMVVPGRSREVVVSGEVGQARPTPAVAVDERPRLPPPVRGAGGSPPAAGVTLLALVGSLAIGAGLGLLQRWWARPHRGPHRGRALMAAVATGDLDRIARCLHALRPGLPAARRAQADAIERAIDAARFGGGQAGDLRALSEPLADVP